MNQRTTVFADSKGASSTPGCHCDGPCPECPPDDPRKDCRICDGYGTVVCEFPCWQRIGLTAQPCCPNCAPLPEPSPEPVATVTDLAERRDAGRR